MSRLEEAKQSLEEALARLENKAASLTPSEKVDAIGQALSQSQAENARLKGIAGGLDRRLDAVIAGLATEIDNLQLDEEDASEEELAGDEAEGPLDDADDDYEDDEDYDDDDYDDDDDEVEELEYVKDTDG